MLVASLAIVIEAGCSSAPAPATRHAESPDRILSKIYTKDNTLYVTSRFAVTDSFVVIQELIRDRKYYPYENEPHLYNHEESYKMPPANLDLPVMIQNNQVTRIEPWKESHETRNGAWFAVGMVGVVVVAAFVAFANAFSGFEGD